MNGAHSKDPGAANEAESYRDRFSNITAKGKRQWVYALQPKGKFYTLRNYFSGLYFLLFFCLPFIKVNGMPLVMINFPEGKFIIFSKIFWPQDFFIFAVAMIAGIVSIALFTVIYGRIFCGWICPQTVFMEMMFRKVEWWIEGSRTQQQKLSERAWDTDKLLRRGGKHLAFLLLSFIVANTFLAYIISLDELLRIIREPIIEHMVLLGGLLFFTILFYVVFAHVRDLTCTTICPYGRLQSVLFDKDTMQISYDYQRGEPRGRLSKKEAPPTGDCIDCHKCVQVCPTGIDIRNGVQMECVGCTACIDVCNEVMNKIGKPEGLIRYASENEIAKGRPFHFNGRMKAYTAVLAGLTLLLIFLIATRNSVDTYVSRVKGQLYQELPDNKLSNLYDAKVINKTNRVFPIELKLEGINGQVNMVSRRDAVMKKEAVNELMFFIVIDKKDIIKRSTPIKIGVYCNGRKIQTVSSTFLGPFI